MVMSWVFLIFLGISIVSSLIQGNGTALASAAIHGAQSGIALCISIAGSLCLWSGIGRLMEKAGITKLLTRLFMPLLSRIFPTAKKNEHLACSLCANVCANFLGLGNAATPMGIEAAKVLALQRNDGTAGPELCRLIVLNTASIQLIPATVAALRAQSGAAAPFDIVPAVWITSICSAGIGLTATWLLEKVWKK